jgi:DUF4097 and DUF4098 domain-containing protein YvlB
MAKDIYKTGDTPFIRVDSCAGELVIRGWAEPSLQIRGDHEIQETEKGFRLSSSGSLRLNAPTGAIISVGRAGADLVVKHMAGPVTAEMIQGDAILSDAGEVELEMVHGDLVARNLKQSLTANEVHGDVAARNTAAAAFKSIYGDLSARRMEGDLTVDTISGDADLRHISGNVAISSGHRDVNLTGITGQVTIAGIKGDIRLRGGLQDGDHSLEAAGDIIVRWPTHLPLNVVASGGRVDNRLPLDEAIEKNGSFIGRIGAGNSNLRLTTPGRIILREVESSDEKWETFGGEMEFDFDVDMAGIAARIETEVNNHLSRMTRDFETKFGGDFAQRFAERVAQKAEKVAERSRRRESRGRFAGFDFSAAPAAPSRPAASTEEQLKILKMVENGKITPQEASMLLEALEI